MSRFTPFNCEEPHITNTDKKLFLVSGGLGHRHTGENSSWCLLRKHNYCNHVQSTRDFLVFETVISKDLDQIHDHSESGTDIL